MKSAVLVFMLAASMTSAQTTNLTSLLQQGLLEEQANRNLEAAIANYQLLAAQFDQDRQLAATAVFRIGECYRLQGKTNAAAAQYQRVLHDFADQTTLATLSRQNLTGMGVNISSPTTVTSSPDDSDAQLWNSLKDLSRSELEKVLPTLNLGGELTKLLPRRNEAEARVAVAQVDYSPTNVVVLRAKAEIEVLNRQIADTIDGEMQALKVRAEISSHANAAATSTGIETTDEEDQEIRRIQTMIQNSPDLINAANNDGNTPLQKAAYAGWFKVAAFLLEHGADINAGGIAALSQAARAGNRAMVEFLLNHGANVHGKGENGKTALHTAAEKNFQTVAEVLLANKAEVNALDTFGDTPLICAAERDNPKMVALLLDHNAAVNVQNNSRPLNVQNNYRPLSGGFRRPEKPGGRTALSFAAEASSFEMVKILLAAKADPNLGGFDLPLFEAIKNNEIATAELLLQAGANPNVSGIVDWNVTINQRIYMGRAVTPLFYAVSETEFPLVQLLLKYQADPNDTQTDGRSLLFGALNDTNILEALLAAGAKADDNADLNHSSPLQNAVFDNNAAAVEILLKHGANVNLVTSDGSTVLYYAAENLTSTNIFQQLLDYKADPNVRHNGVETPLDKLKEWMAGNGSNVTPAKRILAAQLADLLRQHGALDILPDWDRITVSRSAVDFSEIIFKKGTNDWNQFTLLEAILNFYGSSRTHSIAQGNMTRMMNSGGETLPFPDLSRITILRPSHDSTNQTKLVINLLDDTNGIDASKDVPLEFGDVVEIPESNHALSDKPVGLTDGQRETLFNLLKGNVRLVVHGKTVEMPVYHAFDSSVPAVIQRPEARKLLQASSDLSQIKVTRPDAKTGKKQTWIVDCSDHPAAGEIPVVNVQFDFGANNFESSTNLLLRNGDLVEVPEKK